MQTYASQLDVATFCLADASASTATPTLSNVGVIIPTRNAAKNWTELRNGLELQGLESSQILVIDSSSTDATRSLAYEAGYRFVQIPKEEFNHGSTRQLACGYISDKAFLVFMTQDAILANEDSISRLLDSMTSSDVGAAYGRQLPRPSADPIERHGRIFNYPAEPQIKSLECRSELGFKTVFLSNSFAIYRRSALDSVGGFPLDSIVSEEVTVAGKMLLAGWKVAYIPDALVVHSHHLNLRDEFARYFDIGVHHGRETWLREHFGTAGNEGLKFVKSQMSYLWKNKPSWIPYAAVRVLSKLIAYRLGRYQELLPIRISRLLSAQPTFWSRPKSRLPAVRL